MSSSCFIVRMTQPGGSPPPMPRNTSWSSPTWSLATRADGLSKPHHSHDRFADRVQADLVGAGTKPISTQRPQEVQYGSGTNPEFLAARPRWHCSGALRDRRARLAGHHAPRARDPVRRLRDCRRRLDARLRYRPGHRTCPSLGSYGVQRTLRDCDRRLNVLPARHHRARARLPDCRVGDPHGGPRVRGRHRIHRTGQGLLGALAGWPRLGRLRCAGSASPWQWRARHRLADRDLCHRPGRQPSGLRVPDSQRPASGPVSRPEFRTAEPGDHPIRLPFPRKEAGSPRASRLWFDRPLVTHKERTTWTNKTTLLPRTLQTVSLWARQSTMSRARESGLSTMSTASRAGSRPR